MAAIQVADPLYEKVRTRATAAGFATVDEYVAEMLQEDSADGQNYDHLFTPERIASLDRIVANMENGAKLYTEEEVDAHFKSLRESRRSK